MIMSSQASLRSEACNGRTVLVISPSTTSPVTRLSLLYMVTLHSQITLFRLLEKLFRILRRNHCIFQNRCWALAISDQCNKYSV